jgi:hypothetical protein
MINLPISLIIIRNRCFFACSSLTKFIIPNAVKSSTNYYFEKCTSFSEIEVPNSMKSLEDDCFREYRSITSISIPDSVKEIRDCCFRECAQLNQSEFQSQSIRLILGSFRNALPLIQSLFLKTFNQFLIVVFINVQL